MILAKSVQRTATVLQIQTYGNRKFQYKRSSEIDIYRNRRGYPSIVETGRPFEREEKRARE